MLFFRKGEPTRDIFYYQLNTGRNLGKTAPLNMNDMADFLDKFKSRKDSENSWTIHYDQIDKTSYDLEVKNPNESVAEELKSPAEILAEIKNIDAEIANILKDIKL